jgi:hypothetical protein
MAEFFVADKERRDLIDGKDVGRSIASTASDELV